MPRRRRQRCRLILLKRQIKGRGFQKCNQKIFLAHWYAFKLPAKTTLRNFPDGGSSKNLSISQAYGSTSKHPCSDVTVFFDFDRMQLEMKEIA